MEQRILSLFARTPMHLGAGNSVGAIDAPVMRERHTRFPLLPGSSLKGVLSALWNDAKDAQGELFGLGGIDTNAHAGRLLIGEGRLIAFPVRSAKGAFAWLTCPLALKRFQRDTGKNFPVPDGYDNGDTLRCYLTDSSNRTLANSNKVVLEEYCFSLAGPINEQVVAALKSLSDDPVFAEIGSRLVVVSDEMFSFFVENACEVVTRIRVDDQTGIVADGSLFNQEQLPSECMFYAVVGAETAAASALLTQVKEKLNAVGNMLQIGGDATIGLGFCSVKLLDGGRN